jgi:hypothetical protein
MSREVVGAIDSTSRSSQTQQWQNAVLPVEAKALNPIIAMHKAMSEAINAVNSSLRSERKLDKAHREQWEKSSEEKSEEYQRNVRWKYALMVMGVLSTSLGVGGVAFSQTTFPGGATGKQIGDFIQSIWPLINTNASTIIQNWLDGKMPKHDFVTALLRSLYEQGQGSVQQLQRAQEEIRQKEIELMKLEARASGAQVG